MIPLAKAIPITGLAPDDEPTKPGILTDCVNVVPTTNGVKVAPGWLQVATMPEAITGIFNSRDTDGLPTRVRGTASRLRIYRSPLGDGVGMTETTGFTAAQSWAFAQFGNATLASDYNKKILQATSATSWAFTEIADAPKAKIIVSSSNFVLAFGTSDATYGTQGDRWWCSAINDHSSWTPSLSTQATTGRIVQDGGGFTAALPLGQSVVAYKDRAMFVGIYVGSPVVWQWDRVPGYAGAAGPGCVCDIGGAHFVVGPTGFWIFDGVRPQPIGVDVIAHNFFWYRLVGGYSPQVMTYYDRATTCVHIWHHDVLSGALRACLVYNITTGTWGRREVASADVTAVGEIWAPSGPTTGPGTSWMAIAQGVNLKQENATQAPAPLPSMKTGVLGDDSTSTRVLDLRLICARSEATGATVQGYTGRTSGAVTTAAGTGTEMDGKLPIRQHDRWHKFVISLPYVYGSATPEIQAITVNGVTGGSR